MTITILFLVGRVVLAYFFLENAYHHFKDLDGLTEYARSKGVPSPKLATFVTGITLALGGLSILTGVLVPYGIALLIIFLLGTLVKMHTFWKETDPTSRMMTRIEFTKNLAILAALLMILAVPWPWPYSL